MRFSASVLLAAALSTVALPAMSAPVQQVHEVYERDFDDELMAREPTYGRIGTVVFHRPIVAREDKPQPPAQGRQLMDHLARSLSEDQLAELEARGWFSIIKDGFQGISALKSEHDDKKKKKKGKREVEDLYDLYERDFYDYDYY